MKRKILIFVLLSLLVCGVIIFLGHERHTSFGTISPSEVEAIIDRQDTTYIILDVRTEAEFESETGHIPGARLFPLDELEHRYLKLLPLKKKELIVYCRSGLRSADASKFLAGKGFRVRNMEGGILEWNTMKRK